MQATQRRFEPSVIERLFAAPHRFQFFQAVRMIELWFRRNGVPHERAVSDFLRFANRTALGFPASEIERIEAFPADQADQADGATVAGMERALSSGRMKYVCLTPTFMGFLGGSGALPAHYTERIARHQLEQRDDGPRAFLDAFSTRSLALFYQAWSKYRLAFQYEAGRRDKFLPLLLSLSGLGFRSLRERLQEVDGRGVRDESLGHFAGALRHRPASAFYMQRVLGEYFSVPLQIEQFVGSWYNVPPEHQTMLGSTNSALGTAMAGARVWQRDLRMRLRIGPLPMRDFEQFLPGAKASQALSRMLGMFSGSALEYEIQLVLRAEDVRGLGLAADRDGGRLGWDSFISTAPETRDRADICYEISVH
ncbi:type VI secretion system baseplate subunit TssG [Herbaspirillum robiniae]|uniref:Type VI secretion system baseplate subunit TssG n=1 Tax=Herbaspirillum robiniae TaxID=2014887 RepID=A0ABX2LUL5_9BURK|nr:type VI secretion system baseplate subunit TssG [Herbaspirillum robiniae]NUU01334.1 type VI secretion system baseplate subunit TssG [Herbaspirillum robiniae]